MSISVCCFLFSDTATTWIYTYAHTLSLHDALPSSVNPTRRRAVRVATVLETQVTWTDGAVLMFERLVGQMFRRVERREEAAFKRDRRTINGKIKLLARLGNALIAARRSGADPFIAIEQVIGWDELGQEVDEADRLDRKSVV